MTTIKTIAILATFCCALASTSALAAPAAVSPQVCAGFGTWAYQAAQGRDAGLSYQDSLALITLYETTITHRATRDPFGELGEHLMLSMMRIALPSIYTARQLSPQHVQSVLQKSCLDARK